MLQFGHTLLQKFVAVTNYLSRDVNMIDVAKIK